MFVDTYITFIMLKVSLNSTKTKLNYSYGSLERSLALQVEELSNLREPLNFKYALLNLINMLNIFIVINCIFLIDQLFFTRIIWGPSQKLAGSWNSWSSSVTWLLSCLAWENGWKSRTSPNWWFLMEVNSSTQSCKPLHLYRSTPLFRCILKLWPEWRKLRFFLYFFIKKKL